jgi:predicted phage tail protein
MTNKFIAGSGGGGKGGGGGSRTPSTDPDSLNSRSYGRIVDLISEGEIEGLVDGNKSIFLDNTPLENNDGSANFDDVIIKTKDGTPNQTVLDGFVEAANIISNPQSGVEIDSTGQTFTISDPSVDSVIFLISVPTLQKIKNNGDTLGTEFKYQFQRSLANGAFTNFLGEQTITGRTADLYQKQYEFTITDLADTQFPVRFKLKRTSDDDTAFMNGNDEDGKANSDTFISHTSKFFVTSHTLIKQQGANQSGSYTHAGTTIII